MKTPINFANLYIEGKIKMPTFPSFLPQRKPLAIESKKFKTDLVVEIHKALFELTRALFFSEIKVLKTVNREIINTRKKAIKGLEWALEYPFLLKSSAKVIQEELERLKEFDKEKVSYHPIKEVDFSYKCLSNKEKDSKEIVFSYRWLSNKDSELMKMMSTPLRVEKGKPYKFFRKVLQIVVFKLLHEKGNIPIEKAKHLAAEFIKDYFKKTGLSGTFPEFATIDYKDIDNALHS